MGNSMFWPCVKYSETCINGWAPKKWSLNRGGLLIEAKMHGKATIGT